MHEPPCFGMQNYKLNHSRQRFIMACLIKHAQLSPIYERVENHKDNVPVKTKIDCQLWGQQAYLKALDVVQIPVGPVECEVVLTVTLWLPHALAGPTACISVHHAQNTDWLSWIQYTKWNSVNMNQQTSLMKQRPYTKLHRFQKDIGRFGCWLERK